MELATNGTIGAIWLTMALLGAGYARSRGRSTWVWFFLMLFFAPIAALLLVTWPPADAEADGG